MSEPATTADLIQQGLFHHRRGELAQAVERYSAVLRTDPANADALYYVVVIACQAEQFRQGIELGRKALASGPPQARVHNLIGKAHERLREHREVFDAVIAVDPRFAEAHGNRAALLAAAGVHEEALKGFDRALAIDPQGAADWVNRGVLLQELGRHDKALASYDKALALAPLAEIPGVRLISLQKGEPAGEIAQVAFGAKIESPLDPGDLSAQGLLDTAALTANLDAVVSIDSMPAHLAGALGKPVALALPYVPDWRWLLDRDDTPWYPTMRLYRQDAARDWAPVFARIADALRAR